jgi:hypothetical protein
MQTLKVSDADLKIFVAAAQEKTNLQLRHEVGQRYARICILDYDNDGGRTVFCFVDLINGNVLRPAGWKRPNLKVKNSIQGNIYDDQRGSGSMSRVRR